MSASLDSSQGSLQHWLGAQQIPFRANFPLGKISQIKAGGTPRLLVQPESVLQLRRLLEHLSAHALPYLVIGNLSNLLVRSGEIETVVISLKELREIVFSADSVSVGAGALLPIVARAMQAEGYAGFSGLYGVPGSIGGAIFMNASCYGDATSDHLIDVRCLDPLGREHVLRKEELGFGWRHSAFQDRLRHLLIVSARFALTPQQTSSEKLQSTQAQVNRLTYQESTYPNLGSLFATRDLYGDLARHFGVYRMLYALVRIVSRLLPGDRHANFARLAVGVTRRYFRIRDTARVGLSARTVNCVVNRGGAEADDIIAFVRSVQDKLGHRVALEVEILDEVQ